MTYASLLLQINKYLQYADKQEKGGDTIGLHPTSEIFFFQARKKIGFY